MTEQPAHMTEEPDHMTEEAQHVIEEPDHMTEEPYHMTEEPDHMTVPEHTCTSHSVSVETVVPQLVREETPLFSTQNLLEKGQSSQEVDLRVKLMRRLGQRKSVRQEPEKRVVSSSKRRAGKKSVSGLSSGGECGVLCSVLRELRIKTTSQMRKSKRGRRRRRGKWKRNLLWMIRIG